MLSPRHTVDTGHGDSTLGWARWSATVTDAASLTDATAPRQTWAKNLSDEDRGGLTALFWPDARPGGPRFQGAVLAE